MLLKLNYMFLKDKLKDILLIIDKEKFLIPFGLILSGISFILFILNKLDIIKDFGFLNFPFILFISVIFFCISLLSIYKKGDNKLKNNFEKFFKIFLIINIAIINLLNIVNLINTNFFKNFNEVSNILFNLIMIFLLISIIILSCIFKKEIFEKEKNVKNNNKSNYIIIITLSIIIIFGFILRIYKLNFLYPVTDEFYHLLAGKNFLINGDFSYMRAPFVSYITGLLFKINRGVSLYLARIPIVIIGTLSIIAIYYLSIKINKKIAIISSFLLCTLPLAVGMSRYIREYAYFFLITILYIIWSDYIYNRIFERKNIIITLLNIFLIILTPFFYYIFIDDTNFVIQLYIFIMAFFAISFYPLIFKSKNIKKIISIIIILITISIGLFKKIEWLFKIKIPDSYFKLPTLNYFDALFNPSFHPWGTNLMWFSGSIYPTYFIISLFLISILFFYKNKYYLFSMFCFLVTLIPFLYFADRYYAVRYIFYIIIFYIIIFSCSIYILIKIKNIYSKNMSKLYIALSFIFLLSIFNPITVINGLKDEKNGVTDPKKELLSYNYNDLFVKLKELGFNDGDFIITSEGIVNSLGYYFNKYNFISDTKNYPLMRFPYIKESGTKELTLDMPNINVYYYNLDSIYSRPCLDDVCNLDEKTRITIIINNQPNGWIIIDKDRNQNWNKNGFPLKDFNLGSTTIKYLGSTDGIRGFDIYKW